MGQGSSANAGSSRGGAGGESKTCYYELLGVQRNATSEEYVGKLAHMTLVCYTSNLMSERERF